MLVSSKRCCFVNVGFIKKKFSFEHKSFCDLDIKWLDMVFVIIGKKTHKKVMMDTKGN